MADQLATVLQLRVLEEEKAAEKKLVLERNLSSLQQQLTSLEDYALDYQARLSATGTISIQQRQLLSAYLHQVQTAILGQLEKIAAAETQVEQARSLWLAARLNKQAIEKLMEKRLVAQAELEVQRDQKETDALNQVRFVANNRLD